MPRNTWSGLRAPGQGWTLNAPTAPGVAELSSAEPHTQTLLVTKGRGFPSPHKAGGQRWLPEPWERQCRAGSWGAARAARLEQKLPYRTRFSLFYTMEENFFLTPHEDHIQRGTSPRPLHRATRPKLGTELDLSSSLQLSLCSCSGTEGEDSTALTEKLHPFCLSSCSSHAPTDLQSQRWVSGLSHGELVMGQQEEGQNYPKESTICSLGGGTALPGAPGWVSRGSQRNSLPSAAAAEAPNEISSPVHAILGFPWIWCHKHWAVALLYKQERLPQIPKISEKDRKRQKRSLGVFIKRCVIQGIVPVGGGRGLSELWEVEFI
ncbi:uncharacterized protein LOC128817626 isoform X2 [Vidua macroura]|uniref:uncharacterized protein LOC128817626 isoform X2 n=1 Tax=Vidua macroura TaxID=187451 RepID=UPI0023A8E959|nr:uncharacterized protein LOC128817626 isoform X2 [Vidua macroura]